ncbi:MAG: hypothetical protein ACJA1A_003346 [Saprospiraceae bacterium]|jgi:uncharacterized protein (TIGR01777 family)
MQFNSIFQIYPKLVKMKILIAGGTGFIGNTIIENLKLSENIEYHILTRKHIENHNNIHYHLWDGKHMGSWKVYIDVCDILINLAGKSVKCRYNQANKDAIYNSRIDSTFILGEAVSNSKKPPKLWINASSATIYRHETVRANDEYNGVIGEGFSVDVARKWEETFYASYTPFTRKVNMRAAITFGKKAEVFKIYQKHINMYLSGRHGKGDQIVSWVHELDLVKAVKHFIENESSKDNYNIASPNATSDTKFLQAFRILMGKEIGIPIPEWALEIGAFFCGAETEMLLKSRWVFPKRLIEEGFIFKYPKHEKALEELLN